MKFVPARASRFLGRQKLKLNTHSPTLLLGAGIVGVIGTTVLASRATLKSQPVLETAHLELERLRYNAEKTFDETDLRVPENELRKHRVAIYTDAAVQLTKLYGPSVILGAVSIGCLVQSHRILNDRYANVATAYVALQETFDRYRQRIRSEIGDEKEKEIYYDGQEMTVIEPGPNGPKKTKVKKFGDDGGSIYARLWGPETSREWRETPEYNVMFLRQVEKHCNEQLRLNGHVWLNYVYNQLGLEDSEYANVGWLYERGTGDSYIDFGIWDETEKTSLWDFMVGNEGEIMLDFNCDGPINKMLNKPKTHHR